MKNNPVLQFIITTVIGGLVFLVPLVFIGYIVGKAIGFMLVIAEPLAAWIPVDTIGGVALANVIAIVALIVVSFLAGLVARHTLAGGLINTLESKVLMNIPGYSIVKSIKSGFDNSDTDSMKAVAVQLGSAQRIAFEVEKLVDGRSMIYIPSVPNTWTGITQILPAEQITYLDVPVTKIMDLTEKYGYGVAELLQKKADN